MAVHLFGKTKLGVGGIVDVICTNTSLSGRGLGGEGIYDMKVGNISHIKEPYTWEEA